MTPTSRRGLLLLLAATWAVAELAAGTSPAAAQDIVSSQLRQGFGRNKVRYKDFDWHYIESQHLLVHYEPEFEDLAERAVTYLEEGYTHLNGVTHHELSTKPPIVLFKSSYEFQQTNIVQDFLPPGVAGFAEPLRYRMVVPFDGDLEEFRNVLVHELMHIFQYDILNRGPVKRISNPIANPPTWIMEGMAEYGTGTWSTVDEMVLRDAVLTDELIPLEVMDSYWEYLPNPFLAYKQSHSLMEYIADNYGPEKISRLLRAWDKQTDTDKLLESLLDVDMETLDERWSAQMRKKYWPLLQSRDYLTEFATRVVKADDVYQLYVYPDWSLSGDMLVVLSTDGVESNVDIIRLSTGRLVERVTAGMRTVHYDDLTFGEGTVAWAPDGHTIAFVAKKGPRDLILLWDLYDKELTGKLQFDGIEMIHALDWAPDSRRLAFVGTGFGQSDIYYVDVETGQLTQVTGTPQHDDYPAWSPDGHELAYSAKRDGQFDIRCYDVDSGRTRALISGPTDDLWPIWLPEGNKMLFVSTREGIDDLFLYHLEEGREYQLTRTVSGILSPALSPDGKQLVLSTYYHGRQELYRMDMPSWPQIQRRGEELLARAPAGGTRPDSAVAAVPDSLGPVVLRSAAEARTAPFAAAASLEPALPSRQAVKLGEASASLTVDLDQPAAAPETGPLALTGAVAELDRAASDSTTAAGLPRFRYTPKLEFDGLSMQLGYYSGFLSGIAELSMSDLLGNHSLSLFTDYVGSQEISNDLTFALGYTYYGRRPTYSAMVFNWNQYYNNNQYFLTSTGYVQGLVRSQQTGLLADVSYPLDVYRRVELSYSFVDEQQELAWPVAQVLDGFTTHLVKAAYVHDSLNNGLLGPTAGRRYYVSLGRALGLASGSRSFTHMEADYRHYLRLGRWSVLGLRGTGVGSLGRDGLVYNLGGPVWYLPFFPGYNLNLGPLRGYSFSEFSGSRVVLLNSEVRVPFIRNITFGWPGTFSIPAVDGSFFLD
ncbi:MAG: peptidase MA family metallohydrolase, partial [Gemmatimonadota bacterium]